MIFRPREKLILFLASWGLLNLAVWPFVVFDENPIPLEKSVRLHPVGWDVRVKEGSRTSDARPAESLRPGQRIVTGVSSKAKLDLRKGRAIELQESSEAVFVGFRGFHPVFELTKGFWEMPKAEARKAPRLSQIRSDSGQLLLAWEDGGEPESYLLRIRSRDGSFNEAYPLEGTERAFRTPKLLRGTYQVSIESFRGEDPRAGLVSEVFTHFHDPSLKSPAGKAVWVSAAGSPMVMKTGEESFRLAWTGWADSHALQIARDPDFRHLLLETSVHGNHFDWEKPLIGRWFARLRPLRGSGAEESWSESRSHHLLLEEPKILRLSSKRLDWEAHPRAMRFEILAAKTADFAGASRIVTSERSWEIPRSWKGPLFVKVRVLDASDWPVSRYSESLEKFLRGKEVAWRR